MSLAVGDLPSTATKSTSILSTAQDLVTESLQEGKLHYIGSSNSRGTPGDIWDLCLRGGFLLNGPPVANRFFQRNNAPDVFPVSGFTSRVLLRWLTGGNHGGTTIGRNLFRGPTELLLPLFSSSSPTMGQNNRRLMRLLDV